MTRRSPFRFAATPLPEVAIPPVVQDDVFTSGECEDMISSVIDGRWVTAAVVGYQPERVDPNVRRAELQTLPLDGSWPMVTLVRALSRANDQHRFLLSGISHVDAPSVVRYTAESTGHFRPHRDTGPGRSTTRRMTYILQLSDPGAYAGGDLVLQDAAMVASRRRGTLVTFDSRALHTVTPVIHGERYALLGWVHGPALR